jgi:hypothetical protein
MRERCSQPVRLKESDHVGRARHFESDCALPAVRLLMDRQRLRPSGFVQELLLLCRDVRGGSHKGHSVNVPANVSYRPAIPFGLADPAPQRLRADPEFLAE